MRGLSLRRPPPSPRSYSSESCGNDCCDNSDVLSGHVRCDRYETYQLLPAVEEPYSEEDLGYALVHRSRLLSAVCARLSSLSFVAAPELVR